VAGVRGIADPWSPDRRWDKAGAAALFVLLALIAVQCVRLGASGRYVQLAQGELDRWSPASRPPRPAEVRLATRYFLDSLGYASNNPWAHEGLGTLGLARMRASTIPREALTFTRDARVRFRQALLQRPTSPFLWANLALTKLYLNEIDGELFSALRQAEALGPWEPTVQEMTLFVGLAVWRDLDPVLQQALVQTIERGAARNPQKMFDIVTSYRRFDLVCAIEQYQPIAGPDCGKAAAAAKSRDSMGQGVRR
jgi:hypothetical protein